MFKYLAIVALFFSLLTISACSQSASTPVDLAEPKELGAGGGSERLNIAEELVGSPEELVRRAKELFGLALYDPARAIFIKILNEYSPGPYAEFAALKIGDCFFEQGEYGAAAAAYEDFSKEHPASSEITYALLRAARSHELTNRGIGRDPTPLYKAQEILKKLLNDYPDSLYAGAARRYLASVNYKLASHEQTVIKFYKKRGKAAAMEARLIDFKKNWNEFVKDDADLADQEMAQLFEERSAKALELLVANKSGALEQGVVDLASDVRALAGNQTSNQKSAEKSSSKRHQNLLISQGSSENQNSLKGVKGYQYIANKGKYKLDQILSGDYAASGEFNEITCQQFGEKQALQIRFFGESFAPLLRESIRAQLAGAKDGQIDKLRLENFKLKSGNTHCMGGEFSWSGEIINLPRDILLEPFFLARPPRLLLLHHGQQNFALNTERQ
ncbi:MAG TPA: outer membrane protein assembly factor BamD [Oligoflexia bacterium]|nr:outer membrane protein assembly factor BamD [Oligoflexia bacterium]HMP27003.1 outer membrane protein assembly factor BamD [Oligoflexia bacterium]